MTDYLLPFQPSLAQATNTRLDSACKHIQQCRVSTDDMMRFVKEDAEELQRNKYRYCVHKDELVVGIGRPWDASAVMKRVSNAAYPRVISNLGALNDEEDTRTAIRMIRFMNHFARSIRERSAIIKFFTEDVYTPPGVRHGAVMNALDEKCQAFPNRGGKMGTSKFMHLMSDHFAVGYANTVGYAHPNTGDTMTSVMIGGLRTVMNGDFEIFPGDLVQFYWWVAFFYFLFFSGDGNGDRPAGASKRTIFSRMAAGSRTWTSGRGAGRATWTPRRPRPPGGAPASAMRTGARRGRRARTRSSGRPTTSSRTASGRTR